MPDFRPVLYVNGFLLLGLAGAMLLPIAVDLGNGQGEWPAFAGGAALSTFLGLALVLGNSGCRGRDLAVREAFLLVVLAWPLAGLCGAVPFMLSSRALSPTDAVFEAISGLTTTGATVITGLDAAPHALLLWRALLNWLGGLAVLVAAIAILPKLRIGGMQLFVMESADKTARLKSRAGRVIAGVFAIYVLFTIILAGALLLAGMMPFEALCHAMSALSTGGFSTSDASLGNFPPAARYVCMVGMLAGATTFTLFLHPGRRHRWALLDDSQFRWFLAAVAGFGLLLSFWNWAVRDMDGAEALGRSLFNVVSVMTTTGFHVDDYDSWGGFAQVLFFVLAFVGGCTGSTAGGIKIFRFEVLFVIGAVHLKRLIHPSGVFVVDFNRLRLTDSVIRSVLGFMMLYFFCFAALATLLTLTGVDAMTGLAGAVAALGNVGPGLGPVIGPLGSYQPLPVAAKWLLAGGMVLGRLELATILVLTTRAFWRA